MVSSDTQYNNIINGQNMDEDGRDIEEGAENASAQKQPPQPPASAKKRKRNRISEAEKIDIVYNSLDGIAAVRSLLRSTLAAIQSRVEADASSHRDDRLVRLVGDCLATAVDGIDRNAREIRDACSSTSAKRNADKIHRKLTKGRALRINQTREGRELGNGATVHDSLTEALDRTRLLLSEISPQPHPPPSLARGGAERLGANSTGPGQVGGTADAALGLPSADPQAGSKPPQASPNPQPKKRSEKRSALLASYAGKEKPYRLPAPDPAPPGEKEQYSVCQAVNILHAEIVRQAGNGQRGRSIVTMMKDEMIERGYVPVERSQLNKLVQNHGGKGKPRAPLYWNNRGAKMIMTMEELYELYRAHVEQWGEGAWQISDTKEALMNTRREQAEKNLIELGLPGEPSVIREVDPKTVKIYHSALMSLPEVRQEGDA